MHVDMADEEIEPAENRHTHQVNAALAQPRWKTSGLRIGDAAGYTNSDPLHAEEVCWMCVGIALDLLDYSAVVVADDIDVAVAED